MFEMSAGRELSAVLPSDEDYEDVKDEHCKKIIRYIFRKKSKYEFMHSIKQV